MNAGDGGNWGRHVDRYLAHVEYLLRVDFFVVGGGASKKGHKFLPHFEQVGCEVVVASHGNLAGILGAALFIGETAAQPSTGGAVLVRPRPSPSF